MAFSASISFTAICLFGLPAMSAAADADYHADFELPVFHEGNIDGQYMWRVDQGRAEIHANLGRNHTAGLLLFPAEPFTQTRLSLTAGGGSGDIAFVDVYARPVATTGHLREEFLDVDSARIGFFRTAGHANATLWIFHGDGEGGGEWLETGISFPVDPLTGRSANWIRLTIREDTNRQIWDLWADSQWVCASAGFQERREDGSPVCIMMGDSREIVYFDDLTIAADNPAFADRDRDGIPDHVETALGFDPDIDDRDGDPDGDGRHNLDVAIAWRGNDLDVQTITLNPKRITFSEGSGFRAEPFLLTISGHGAGRKLYFTQDGSDPTQRGDGVIEYVEPIAIDRTQIIRAAVLCEESGVEAVASAAWVFPTVAGTGNRPPGWPVSFRAWGHEWRIPYGVVIPDRKIPDVAEALRSAPVVILGTDRTNLFSGLSGVYARSDRQLSAPVEVIIIDPRPDREEVVQGSIQLSGQSSRRHYVTLKHSIRISLSSEEQSLFGGGGRQLLLRNPTHDSWTHRAGVEVRSEALYFSDALISGLMTRAGHPQPRHRFVHVFLNEVYWGVYDAVEQLTPTESTLLLEPDQRGIARAIFGDTDEWRSWMATLEALSAAARLGDLRESGWETALGKVDTGSLIDYILINCWAGTLDWPVGNWLVSTERHRFTFCMWDSELAFRRRAGTDINRVTALRTAADGPARAFTHLMHSAQFREMVRVRCGELLRENGLLSPASILAEIDTVSDQFRAVLPAEEARWGGDYQLKSVGADQWEDTVRWLKSEFATGRAEVLSKQIHSLLDQFDLLEAEVVLAAEARKSYSLSVGLPDDQILPAGTPDTDGDGIPDDWEVFHSLNPFLASDAHDDPDEDGLSNRLEAVLGRDPNVADSRIEVFSPQETSVFTPFDGAVMRGERLVPLHGDAVGRK